MTVSMRDIADYQRWRRRRRRWLLWQRPGDWIVAYLRKRREFRTLETYADDAGQKHQYVSFKGKRHRLPDFVADAIWRLHRDEHERHYRAGEWQSVIEQDASYQAWQRFRARFNRS